MYEVLDDELVLLNPIDSTYYRLNRVGCRFWKLLEGSAGDVVARMLEEFDVERETLIEDLARLAEELADVGLIVVLDS